MRKVSALPMVARFSLMILLIVAIMTASPHVQAQTGTSVPATELNLEADLYAEGFSGPLYLTHAHDGSNRIFVIEKQGRIQILQDGKKLDTPFMDITSIVNSASSERGLLGLAFHPMYKDNGLFYVHYSDKQGDTAIAQYKVSADNPDLADPKSAKLLLHVDQPYPNHNGGEITFGPDGYLYIGLGDGGSGGDPQGNGQNTQALLGKILRIDVNSGDPYGIPSDNPYADGKNGRPEVYAIGLRNPWRFSFDRTTGDLYIADVGQNAYEEIHFQAAKTAPPLNYGWNIMEAAHCYRGSSCDQKGLTLPIAEYEHSDGCSVTGGYVYRGTASPRMQGIYFFSDFCSGKVWALQRSADDKWQLTELMSRVGSISSFGEDEAGEIYLTDLTGGNIYHLVDKQ
jgi:glucose/arabinose dehydrogenase